MQILVVSFSLLIVGLITIMWNRDNVINFFETKNKLGIFTKFSQTGFSNGILPLLCVVTDTRYPIEIIQMRTIAPIWLLNSVLIIISCLGSFVVLLSFFSVFIAPYSMQLVKIRTFFSYVL